MKRLVIIAMSLWLNATLYAQPFDNPDELINGLFKALSQPDVDQRHEQLSAVFVDQGTLSSITTNNNQNKYNLGNWEAFVNDSKSFYEEHRIIFTETDRAINYYQDVAHVHGELIQSVVEKTGQQRRFEQVLWYTLQIAYTSEGWKAVSVVWINEWSGEIMEETIQADTIWHKQP